MADNDVTLKDYATRTLTYFLETKDLGSSVRRVLIGTADGANIALGAMADALWSGSGAASVISLLKRIALGPPPVVYTTAYAGALTSAWKKVATVTNTTRAFRIDYTGSATSYAVEWIAFPAGTYANDAALAAAVAALTAPSTGAAVGGGESFDGGRGMPLGDVYSRDAAGVSTIVLVQTGA